MINYTEFINEALAQEGGDVEKVIFKINAVLNEVLLKEKRQKQLNELFDHFENEWNSDSLTPEGIAGLLTWYIINNYPEHINSIDNLQKIIMDSVRPYI